MALLGVLAAALLVAWAPAFWAVSVLQIGVFGLAMVWAARLWMARSFTRQAVWPSPALLAALALVVAWGPLQLLLHTTVFRFETWAATLYWLTGCVVFYLSSVLLKRSETRHRFLSGLLYFGFGLVVVAILQFYTAPKQAFWLFGSRDLVIGPFVYKNQFAAFIELLLPIALYRMLVNRGQTLAYAFLAAMMFASIAATASRGGVVMATLEVFVVLFLGWRRRLVTGRTGLLLLGLVAALLAICVAILGLDVLLLRFQDQMSAATRGKLLNSTFHMIRDRPWLGYGLGTWRAVYPGYALFDNSLFANAAHSDWAQWSSEGGLLFLLPLAFVGWRSVELAARFPWGLGVSAVLIHSAFDYPTREPVIGAILFALLGAMAAAYEGAKRRE